MEFCGSLVAQVKTAPDAAEIGRWHFKGDFIKIVSDLSAAITFTAVPLCLAAKFRGAGRHPRGPSQRAVAALLVGSGRLFGGAWSAAQVRAWGLRRCGRWELWDGAPNPRLARP